MEQSVSPITIYSAEEIIEICYLIDVSMYGMFNRPRKTVTKMSRISSHMILGPVGPLKKLVQIYILPNISGSKGNQTIKFGQLIEYKTEIFSLKPMQKLRQGH